MSARSPEYHYREADRLLSTIGDDQLDLPFAKARIAKAHAHAVLATCPDWYSDDPADGYSTYISVETRAATQERL